MLNEEPVKSHYCPVWVDEVCGKSQADFGTALGISGDTMIVGHPNAGAIHVFERVGNDWREEAIYTGSGGFGSEVGIEGDVFAVGAPDDSEVHIWTRGEEGWEPSTIISGGGCLGSSVALSEGRLVAGNSCESRIHLFEHTGEDWAESALLSVIGAQHLGYVVAFDGNRIAAGSSDGVWTFHLHYGQWSSDFVSARNARTMGISGDTIATTSAGRATIYGEVGSEWVQTWELRPEDVSPFDTDMSLGKWSLTLERDTLILGVPEDDASPGSVHMAQDVPSPCISESGVRLCVPPTPGAVYIYERSSGEWSQEQKITGDLAGDGGFGSAVALSSDGATFAVGESSNLLSGFASTFDVDPVDSVHMFSRLEV